MDDASIREHEEVTKVKNIQSIQIGRYIVDTWYFSPFPKEMYPTGHTDCVSNFLQNLIVIQKVRKHIQIVKYKILQSCLNLLTIVGRI